MEWVSGCNLGMALISQERVWCTLSLVERAKLFSKTLILSGGFSWDFVSSLLSVLGLYLICINVSQ